MAATPDSDAPAGARLPADLPNRYVLSLVAVAPEAGEVAALISEQALRWAHRYGLAPQLDSATPLWTAPTTTATSPVSQLRGMLLLPGTHIIGRSPECGLHFPVRGLSRRHAALLVLQGRGLVLRDLGSTNGSFLNGQRVREAAVDGPALLDIGPLRFALRPATM